MKSLILCSAVLLLGSAQASTITLVGTFSGANENPPIASPGTGTIIVTLDTGAMTIDFNVAFSGLTSNVTAAHIHCCTVVPNSSVATAVPVLPGFPMGAGVTSGLFDPAQPFDLTQSSFYNPSFVTAQGGLANAEAALINGLISGNTYFNIHTSANPGGEIRAFLVPTPEPASFGLAGLAILACAVGRRLRK
jgi:hypothetical protein